MPHIRAILGIAGVEDHENRGVKLTAAILQWCMILIVIWLLIQGYLQVDHFIPGNTMQAINWGVWGFFVFETVLVTSIVKRHWLYFYTNWLNLAIIVLAYPYFWEHSTEFGILRFFRIFLILYLALPLGHSAKKGFSTKRLGVILCIFILVTLLSGLFLAYIDPQIGSPWRGIWWAFQTITTVGYGDVLPVTAGGRVFAIFFMLFGIGLLATLSASFAFFLLSKKASVDQHAVEAKVLKQIEMLSNTVEDLKKEIQKK